MDWPPINVYCNSEKNLIKSKQGVEVSPTLSSLSGVWTAVQKERKGKKKSGPHVAHATTKHVCHLAPHVCLGLLMEGISIH